MRVKRTVAWTQKWQTKNHVYLHPSTYNRVMCSLFYFFGACRIAVKLRAKLLIIKRLVIDIWACPPHKCGGRAVQGFASLGASHSLRLPFHPSRTLTSLKYQLQDNSDIYQPIDNQQVKPFECFKYSLAWRLWGVPLRQLRGLRRCLTGFASLRASHQLRRLCFANAIC